MISRVGELLLRVVPDGVESAWAVFERESLVTSSAGKFVVFRTLVVALPALVVLVFAWVQHRFAAQQPEEFGRAIATVAAVLIPVVFVLITAGTSASSIASERERDTLRLVRAAPISPLGLVLSKFLSRLMLLLILLAATFPPVTVSLLFGGVDTALLPAVFVLTASWTAYSCAVATCVSTFCGRSTTAARVAILASYVPVGFHVWAVYYFGGSTEVRNTAFLDAWFELMRAAGEGRGLAPWMPWNASAVLLAACVPALALGVWRMSREGRRRGVAAALDKGGRRSIGSDAIAGLLLRRTIWRRRSLRAWLELVGQLALPLGVGITAVVWAVKGWRLDELVWLLVVVAVAQGLLAVLVVLGGCATSVARERETGAWPLLRATLISPSSFAGSVLRAQYLRAAVPLAGGWACLFAAHRLQGDDIRVTLVLAYPGIVLASALVAAAIGLDASTRADTSAKAATRAGAVPIGGMLLHGLALLGMAAAGAPGDLTAFVGVLSPPALVAIWCNALYEFDRGLDRTPSRLELPDPDVLVPMLVWTVGYALLTYLLLANATRRIGELDAD